MSTPAQNETAWEPDSAEAVVIGASAGAVAALSSILPTLPTGYPLPIFVVVHVPPERPSSIAELFRTKCAVRVKEAEDKEPIEPGTVYFAPPDYHLLVETEGVLSLSSEEPVNYSRPSIDVLFESAADAYGAGLVGVVLTGANHDGAHGLAAICAGGGQALVQNPASAECAAMPQAALENCPSAEVKELSEIAEMLHRVSLPRRPR